MNNPDKINALIIDDKALNNNYSGTNQGGRKESMTTFLNEKFTLFFLDNLEEKEYLSKKISENHVQVIFIDMHLGGKNEAENKALFLDFLDEINKSVGAYFPIVIYSGKFSETLGWYHDIYKKKCSVIDSFGLDESDRSTYNVQRIYDRINSYYNHNKEVTNIEDVKILLLSDLQISDPDTNISAKFQIVNRIADAINTHAEIGNVDLIVILGDITYSGEVDQFVKAEEWIENLWEKLNFKNTYSSDYRKRLLLIPGNHDVNITLSAIQEYSFRKEWIKRPKEVTNYQEFALKPFYEFAYRMTEDDNWLKYREHRLNFINDNFKYLGLRFVHLNSVHELNHIKDKQSYISFNENILDDMSQDLTRNGPDLFRIVLSHNGFDDSTEIQFDEIGRDVNVFYEKRVPRELWEKNIMAVGNWLNRLKKGYNLWFKGHSHFPSGWQIYKFETDDGPLGISNVKYRVVGTPTLGGNAKSPKAHNGFDILKLKRDNNNIIAYQLFAFHQIDGDFEPRISFTDKSYIDI